mmetsp:Transcript_19170/g.42362  ORF Transcript_19170/g.42362 Transcript_19170/m.42362 type:complete len:238 (+) Transcript_19170:1401-2114(+)
MEFGGLESGPDAVFLQSQRSESRHAATDRDFGSSDPVFCTFATLSTAGTTGLLLATRSASGTDCASAAACASRRFADGAVSGGQHSAAESQTGHSETDAGKHRRRTASECLEHAAKWKHSSKAMAQPIVAQRAQHELGLWRPWSSESQRSQRSQRSVGADGSHCQTESCFQLAGETLRPAASVTVTGHFWKVMLAEPSSGRSRCATEMAGQAGRRGRTRLKNFRSFHHFQETVISHE